MRAIIAKFIFEDTKLVFSVESYLLGPAVKSKTLSARVKITCPGKAVVSNTLSHTSIVQDISKYTRAQILCSVMHN